MHPRNEVSWVSEWLVNRFIDVLEWFDARNITIVRKKHFGG